MPPLQLWRSKMLNAEANTSDIVAQPSVSLAKVLSPVNHLDPLRMSENPTRTWMETVELGLDRQM
jgi:hypothetical protein